MRIVMKKRADGGAVLSCTRADGSVTWQRHSEKNAGFFPLHDLTHYAVETTLGHSRGFYGLLAEGWDIGDFGAPWPRGPMPIDALTPELIVGFLDAERASGVRWTAADLEEKVEGYCEDHGVRPPWVPLTDADLAHVRSTAAALIERWQQLRGGEELALDFHVVSGASERSR